MKSWLKPLSWLLIGLMVGAVGTYAATFSKNRLLVQNNADLEAAVARMEKENSQLTTQLDAWKSNCGRATKELSY